MISVVKSPPLSHHRRRHTHLKILCFFNGSFSSADDPLRYTGGDTKLVYVDRPVTFAKLVSKLNSFSASVLSSSFVLNYQLGSAVGRLNSDDDVRRVVDAFDKLRSCGNPIRLKLFVCKPDGVGSGHRSKTRIPLEDLKKHEQQGRIMLKQPGPKPGLDSDPGQKPGPGFEGLKCDIVAKYNRLYFNDVNLKVDTDLGLRVLRNGGVDRLQMAAIMSLKPGSNGFRDKNDRSMGNVNGESIRVSSGNQKLVKNGPNGQCCGESDNSGELSLKPGINSFCDKKDSGIGDVNGKNIIFRAGSVSLVKNGQNGQCCGESGHRSELSLMPGSNGLRDKKDSGIGDVNGEIIIFQGRNVSLVKNGQNCNGSGESVPAIPSESVSGELCTSIRNIRFSVKDDARREQQCVPIRVSPNTGGAIGNKLAGEETVIDSLSNSHNGDTNGLLVVKEVEYPQLSSRAECVVTSKPMDIMDVGKSISSSLVKELDAVASNPSLQDSAKREKQSERDKKDREVSPSGLCSAEQVNHGESLSSSKVIGGASNDLAAFYTNLATRELQSIKNSDLEFIKELGSGTYGTVYHGKWKGSNVAIKKINPGCFTDGALEDKLLGDFWKEAHILGQLHHPNIVAFYGVVKDGPVKNLATVTEYMVNGSLRQVLRRKDRTIDRRKRMILAMDAAFGMEYLHEKGIVHFDLKSHNFLVNMKDPHRPVCKIGDLGLSKIKQRTLVSGGVRGTVPWMAPELLNFNSKNNLVTDKVDVYSFGIVMWELLTGEEPYANLRSEEIIGGIINGNLRPEIPSWCDPTWRSLMERCWSSDPESRPPFSEISKELRAMSAAMNIE